MKNVIYILTFTLLISCSIQKEKYNSIIIGYFCGECIGQCFQGYYISGDSVYKLSFHSIDSINLEKKRPVLDKREIENIKKIETLLPSDLNKYPDKIGSPDSRDQCGIYILAKYKKKTKKILIDTDKPDDFKKVTVAIKNLKLI
jgi:hypothetical protein